MSFPRYPEYKNSGVEWLGETPAHWRLDRMKQSIISAKNGIWGDDAQGNDDDIPCVRVADFDRIRLRVELDEPTIRNVKKSEREGRVLRRGDLLLEKSGGGETQPVGCVVLYDNSRDAVCSNFVARIEMRASMCSSFWRYVHAAAYYERVNTKSIKQTSGIQNLDAQAYFDEIAPFPPLVEQKLIAGFLDRETAKIDALVAEQRRLMELLKDKRQAVISHAVTKGLNLDAPMKDSGVQWLGEVPAHWQVLPLKRVVASPITDGPHETPQFFDEGVPFVSAEAVSSGTLDFAKVRACISEADNARYSLKYAPRLHDIFMVKSGATTGVTAIVDGRTDFNIWSPLAVVRCGPSAVPRYVLHYMRSKNFQDAISLGWNFGTQQNIGMKVIENLACALPPIHEQASIASYITAQCESFNALMEQASQTVGLLAERRSALITAAVTGQIDVRKLAPAPA